MTGKLHITEIGLQQVDDYVHSCTTDYRRQAKKANEAWRRLMDAYKMKACPHNPKDLECLGGIERVETHCKQCGFSWMD